MCGFREGCGLTNCHLDQTRNGRLSAIPVSIKQNVRFKGGICSEKLNQIQNGRLETFIINFDMSDIEKTVPDR